LAAFEVITEAIVDFVPKITAYAEKSLAGPCVGCFHWSDSFQRLLWLSYAFRSPMLFWPQAVGFWLCWMTLGIHADYWMTAMPLKAALYTILIVVVWSMFIKLHASRR